MGKWVDLDMRRYISLLLFIGLAWGQSYNYSDSDSLDPTRSAFGAGVGFTGLLHIDYQRWMTEQTSFEVGLTPLILHNVVAVAVTQHFNLPSSTKSFDTNLVVSGMWMHIVNMGGIAGGPGMRMGLV